MRPALITPCLFGGVVSAAPGEAVAAKSKPAHPVLPAGPGYQPTSFLGRVESIGIDAFTVNPERTQIERTFAHNPDGSVREERVYTQDNTQPSKTFVFSDSLLAADGRLPAARRLGLHHKPLNYHVSDVRVGDVVYLSYRRVAGMDTCVEIEILRRPGGRVPDARTDKPGTPGRKVATQTNAEQFVEETIAGKWAPRLLAGLKK